MLRAVIFDFDGVITDSEILHLRSFNQVLAQYNIEISTKDYYKDYLGLTDLDLLKLLADKGLLKLDDQAIISLAEQKKQVFEKLARTEGRIIEGVRNFLEMLNQNNILMAIFNQVCSPIYAPSTFNSFFSYPRIIIGMMDVFFRVISHRYLIKNIFIPIKQYYYYYSYKQQ